MPHRFSTACFVLILGLGFAPVQASGNGDVITARDAYSLAQEDELTVIDIRRPSEWTQTGIPEGALTISMHNPAGQAAFLQELTAGVSGDKSTPIGLICASGVRSTWAAGFLARNGFTHILNIKEGLLGRGKSPGWIKQGLPTSPAPSK